MRIRDWSSDVCASDLLRAECAVGERCLRRWRRDQVLRPRKAIEGPWHIGVEFTAPVDGIDIESERILAQHVGRSGRLDLDGQHRGPARGAGQAAALIFLFGPFDLTAGVRSAYKDRKRVVQGKSVSGRVDL